MFIESAHLEYYSHPLIRMNFHRRLDHDAGRPLQCYHHVVPGGKLNGCLVFKHQYFGIFCIFITPQFEYKMRGRSQRGGGDILDQVHVSNKNKIESLLCSFIC